jgi:hypothetical protein
MWQANPYFKVQFLLLVRVLLYGFHRGYLSLTLVHAPTRIFVKRTIVFIPWNEIKQLLFCLIYVNTRLGIFSFDLHIYFLQFVIFIKLYKNVIFCNNLLF